MAYIRDTRTTNVVTNVNNITIDLPVHQAGDMLIVCVAKDSTNGGNFSTPSGWSQLGADILNGSAVRTAIFYKENVSASETAPNTTSTDTDTWSAVAVSLGGVPTSNVIGASATDSPTYGSSHQADYTSLTTTQANSLVLWMYGTDGAAQTLVGDNVRLLNFDDGVGCSAIGFAKTQATAGATGTLRVYSGGTEQTAGMAIEIKDGSGGSDVMPYVEGGINSGNVINTLHAIETNTYAPAGVGSGITQAPVISSLAGKTLSATNTLIDQVDANAVPYARAMRLESDRNATTAFGLTLDIDVTGSNAVRDMTGDRHIYAIIHHVDKKKHSLGGLAENFGTAFVLHDSSNNWKAWGVDGRNATRKLASPIAGPVLIHLDSNVNVLGTSGTLSKTTVDRFTVAAWAQLANNHYTYVCNVFLADPIVLLGGSSGFPAGVETLYEYSLARQDETVLVIADNDTYLLRWLLEVGDGSTVYDSNFDNRTIFFASSDIGTHIVDDYFGIEVNSASGCSISAVDSLWKSKTPFRFDIQNSAGTIDFTGASIDNAQTFNIRGTFVNSTLKPSSGSFVRDFGADITGARVVGDIVFEVVKDIDNVTITGDLELTQTGTYDFTDCTLNTLTNDSGGSVTVNISGGNSPTVVNGPGASTTINNNVSWVFQVVDDNGTSVTGCEITVTDGGASPVELFHVESSGTGTEVYSFAGSNSGNDATILVVKSGVDAQEPFFLDTVHPAIDTTTTIQLSPDRVESNPL